MNKYESTYYENMRQAVDEVFIGGSPRSVYCPMSCRTNGVIDPEKVSCEFVIPQKWIKIINKNLLMIEKPCSV